MDFHSSAQYALSWINEFSADCNYISVAAVESARFVVAAIRGMVGRVPIAKMQAMSHVSFCGYGVVILVSVLLSSSLTVCLL